MLIADVNVKKAVLLPLGALILLLTSLALWGLNDLYDDFCRSNLEAQRKSVAALFNFGLDRDAELINELMEQVTLNGEFTEAWEDRNRDKLLRLGQTMLARFQADHGISHLCLIEPDETCFLRVHNPHDYGNEGGRITLDRAVATESKAHGIELDPSGTFTLRVVQPWFKNGELLGYLEMGTKVDKIVDKIKKTLSVDLIMMIDKRYLDRQQWEAEVRMTGHGWRWDQLPYCAVVGMTLPGVPNELKEYTRQSNYEDSSGVFSATLNDRVFLCDFARLVDAGNRPVGDFTVLSDITNVNRTFQTLFGLLLLIGIVAGGLTVAFMDNYLSKVVVDLNHMARIRDELGKSRLLLQETQAANRRMAGAQAVAQMGSWEITLKTRKIWASEEAFRIYGFERTSPYISVSRILSVIVDEDRERVMEALKEVLNGGEKYDIDFRLKSHDGSQERVIYSSARMIRDAGGTPVKVEGFIQDITDNVKTDAQKRQLKGKLERAERMESLGMMAGGVAHDLNNMLGPIVGYPELLLRKLEADSPYRKQIERIGSAAKDAAEVIKDLLTLARRGRYEMVPLNLNDVIREYLDSAGFLKIRDENPEIATNVQLDDKLDNIIGSSAHLAKVIMNLIVNAFDAMPTGGKVTISTELKYCGQLESGYKRIPHTDYVIVRVADTGMGIPPDAIERIFEPYYSKKKMGRSGSGLGLAVVYGIVKDHNGFYDVFSKVGEFTEFVLYLPVTRERIENQIDDDQNLVGKESILVVDDTAIQLEVAQTLLTNQGYVVHTAESGQAAVNFLKSNPVDLILLDMIMDNGIDGLDTYRELIRLRPGQKAVLVTGGTMTERLRQAQELGAALILKKPYTLKAVSRVVRQALDGEAVAATADLLV